MKTIQLILISICISIIFSSCSSEDSPNQPNKLVKSEKISETRKIDYTYNANGILTNSTGTDPNYGFVSNFTYDSGNRLTAWSEELTGSWSYSDHGNNSYDSQGRLIHYSSNTQNVVLEYNGNIVSLSGTIEGDANSAATLELNSNGLITKFTETNKYSTFEYDSNGNMTVVKSYNNNDTLLRKFTISCDNKVNPFYGQYKSVYIERFIESFWEFEGVHISSFGGYFFPYFKNNIVSIAETNGGATTYTYAYDIDNHPVNVNLVGVGESSTFTIAYY